MYNYKQPRFDVMDRS